MAGGPGDKIDLDDERRAYVVEVHDRLDTLTYYELLDVRTDAARPAIKRAYFELVRTMHPDRYFGKSLGAYGPKLAAIFQRMTAAYDTLSDPARRAAYDQANAERLKTTSTNRPVDPRIAASRQAAMDALRRRFTEAKGKASEHVAAAVRARAAGDIVACAEAYRAALEVTPGDPKLQAALAEVEREAGERLIESHRSQARIAERWGRWSEAIESWQQVLDARPTDAEARARIAEATALASKNR